MATLGDVSSYLRQRRAIGKPVTDADKRAAWSAYFDVKDDKALHRSRLALEQARLDTQKDQWEQQFEAQQGRYETADEQWQRQFDLSGQQWSQNYALQQKAAADAERAARVQGITQVGMMGAQLADTQIGQRAISGIAGIGRSAIGGLTGSTAATQGTQAISGVMPSSELAAKATGYAPAVAGLSGGIKSGVTSALGGGQAASMAGTAAAGIASAGVGIAAGYAADKLVGHKMKEAGSIASGAAAGTMIMPGVGTAIGAVLGGLSAVASKITWLCTKTKETVGLSWAEQKTILESREYMQEHHGEWFSFYLEFGNDLVAAIGDDKEFYEGFKKSLVQPFVALLDGGYHEAAYLAYKSAAMQLLKEYRPDLIEFAPGGES